MHLPTGRRLHKRSETLTLGNARARACLASTDMCAGSSAVLQDCSCGCVTRCSAAWWIDTPGGEVPCCAAGAGECLGSGAAGTVFAAEWDGAQVAIKVPTESDDCSLDDARLLLQLEEEAYRYLDEHLEGCPAGALAVRRPC